jgi:hypothetical protein
LCTKGELDADFCVWSPRFLSPFRPCRGSHLSSYTARRIEQSFLLFPEAKFTLDGRDGRDGRDGSRRRLRPRYHADPQGDRGPLGREGHRGPHRFAGLNGRDGRDGRDGPPGPASPQESGEREEQGYCRRQGPLSAIVLYLTIVLKGVAEAIEHCTRTRYRSTTTATIYTKM